LAKQQQKIFHSIHFWDVSVAVVAIVVVVVDVFVVVENTQNPLGNTLCLV